MKKRCNPPQPVKAVALLTLYALGEAHTKSNFFLCEGKNKRSSCKLASGILKNGLKYVACGQRFANAVRFGSDVGTICRRR